MINKHLQISWIQKKVSFSFLTPTITADGTNVDNWEIDELTQAVGEFVYYQNE